MDKPKNTIELAKGEKKRLRKKAVRNSKYNWRALENEFLNSKHKFVYKFLEELGMVSKLTDFNGQMKRMTKGWGKRKLGLLDQQWWDIRDRMRGEMEIYIREMILDLRDAKNMAINVLQQRLSEHAKKGPFGYFLKVGDIVTILNVIKTELGEPTTITKNSNINANLDINKLVAQINTSDKPINSQTNDADVFGQPELPAVTIDGREL